MDDHPPIPGNNKFYLLTKDALSIRNALWLWLSQINENVEFKIVASAN